MEKSRGWRQRILPVSKDSSGTIESVISNDNLEGDKYITVKDGQYIKLNNTQFVCGLTRIMVEPFF